MTFEEIFGYLVAVSLPIWLVVEWIFHRSTRERVAADELSPVQRFVRRVVALLAARGPGATPSRANAPPRGQA